jgi:O-antigen/teichoic acid export membrane protein
MRPVGLRPRQLVTKSPIFSLTPTLRKRHTGEAAMNRIHRSIYFSAVERYGSFFFLLLSTAILARLLTPEEFGIYTTIYALTALASLSSREFGGVNYLIQKPSLSEQDIRTAFTISFCISAMFAALLLGVRDAAASFYSQQGLKQGITIAALNFALSPFSGTISALLRREMAFDAVARCNLTANFVTAVTSVTLVSFGCSFMGPILGSVVGHAALVALFIAYGPSLRIFRPSFKGCRDVVGFGAYSSPVAVINIFYQMSPQLILARVLDFTAVGLYGRAVNVTQMFDRLVLDVLSPVIMPAILAQTRAGADLKRIYLRAVELITAVQWPFLIFTALMAEPIVWILLGPSWTETIPLVRMLCLASLSMFAACLTYPVLVALGRVRDTLVASLISLPPSLLVIFVASFFGVRAVAASAFLTLPFQVAVALYFISRRLAIRPTELVRAMLKSGIVTACSAAGVMLVVAINDFSFAVPMLGFLGSGVAGVAGWCLGLTITTHPLLAQMRLAGRGIFVAVPRFPFLRRGEVIRPEGNSF